MRIFNLTETRRAQEADVGVPPVLRLLVTLDRRPATFTGRLERTGEVIVGNTGQPLADAARVLVERGFAAELVTMRHVGAAHDSFRPLPVGAWAEVSFTEGETTPLRRQAWKPRQMPIAAVTEGQNSSSAGPAAVRAARTEFAPAGRRNRATAGRPAAALPPRSSSVAAGQLGERVGGRP